MIWMVEKKRLPGLARLGCVVLSVQVNYTKIVQGLRMGWVRQQGLIELCNRKVCLPLVPIAGSAVGANVDIVRVNCKSLPVILHCLIKTAMVIVKIAQFDQRVKVSWFRPEQGSERSFILEEMLPIVPRLRRSSDLSAALCGNEKSHGNAKSQAKRC